MVFTRSQPSGSHLYKVYSGFAKMMLSKNILNLSDQIQTPQLSLMNSAAAGRGAGGGELILVTVEEQPGKSMSLAHYYSCPSKANPLHLL